LSLSEAEAFGMTVLEGVAAGCQVVCSDIPAFCDLAGMFPGHVTVVGRRNAAAGATAVREAAQRLPGTRADVTAFTWDAVTERVLEVYRRVTGTARTLAEADGPQMAKPEGDHLLAGG
jgi:glycosyltransferase involved in cell wall biosynthesis